MSNKIRLILFILVALAPIGLTSCWPLVAGAGAAGGYMAHKEGYRVQNPVTKDE